MKQVALLHYAAPPVVGGVESTLRAHARLFSEAGYAVRVIAGSGKSLAAFPPLILIPKAGSRHPAVEHVQHDLAAGQAGESFRNLADELHAELKRALVGCDICIVHNAATLNKNLALTAALHRLAQDRHVRVIAWCHDFAWTDPLYQPQLHQGWPWELLKTPWPGVRYVVVSAARRAELSGLLGLPAEQIAVVPPGISPREFLGLGQRAVEWMGRWELWQANPFMLLPARVTRRKNMELAIQITAALRALGRGRSRGSTPKLIVMGPLGPHNAANADYLRELKRLGASLDIAEDVIFLQEHGNVNDAARRDLYLLADLLLFPSLREGFGIPILEAGVARLPIFCADIPPFHESAGPWASYIGLDEAPAAIAARIAARLDEDSQHRLRRRVLEEYNWANLMTGKIVPLLEETWI
jgi:glycosyltransferase involved in cell wall biosynthesis